MEWMLMPLKRYAEFSGRSRRKEYWMFALGLFLLYLVMIVVLFAVGGTAILGAAGGNPAGMAGAVMGMGAIAIVFVLVGLALIIPSLAVAVRRLHDTDRSGWWLAGFYAVAFAYGFFGQAQSAIATILMLVYAAAGITFLVFMVLPGTKGPNRFGEDPLGTGSAEVFA